MGTHRAEPQPDLPPEGPIYVDGATRISRPNPFDRWYYAIEDRLGQGTVGMGVCFIVFLLVLVFAVLFHPI